MTLTNYFSDKPRGSKVDMAKALGISKHWLSLIINLRRLPSAQLACDIEIYTKRKVTRKELRPDVFGKL